MRLRMDGNWNLGQLLGVVVVCFLCQNFHLSCCLNDEGLALLRFRERVLSDPFGALLDWKEEDGEVDPCSWFGVECSDGKVVALNLKDLCLRGTLAPELAKLVQMKSIILRNNSFSGIIPEEIGELKELEILDLGYNNFSGTLPPEFGCNVALTTLLVDNNEHLGDLPPDGLPTLSESQADENQLSNAAEGSSCHKRSVAWNVAQTEDTFHRRLLKNIDDKPQNIEITASPPPIKVIISSAPPSPSPSLSASSERAKMDSPTPSTSPPSQPSSATSPAGSPASSAKGPNHLAAILAGAIGTILISAIGVYLCKSNKVATVRPWATGLSGQLQKAFVTGVPKLKRSDLEAACEDFSNVIGSSPIGTVYKGTLSSGVEIAVASVGATSAKDWSNSLEAQFRWKIDTLSKVNHKNFVSLLGYCQEDEPFTRMMVFEYAPNGTLFEHLHIKEAEHLNWGMRLRIAMGMAYCLEHMHQLNPPIAHHNLNSSAVSLTEDYSAKISEFSFWNEIVAAEIESAGLKNLYTPSVDPERNVYSFGVILFEIVTGRLPYSVDNGSLEDWASDYLRGGQPLREIVDPTLTAFHEEQLELMGEVVKSCVHPDPKQRPAMREISARLRAITGITPEGANPKLSPLWWAELEITSADGS
ncbi:LOW QUALITY PROTEIN: probable inactive receptor-like protein kinase At3g56050 [Juglans microcarpa x Juglans regia]|uniref:LOW QUALITY PROTEIN: probable inactive receptor-like protein kinase At3g56050 n=1 Tax=Juglans microcarpa x Juglans regia TaxID=2249226 RepID=UPI001B7EE3BE|nr:LOW QUALITY PROTEIN: probable inactive receptor-like protein kinase At3g56050 [Juglans microcarpa x Juglans regia]